jgi:hypothetical protein
MTMTSDILETCVRDLKTRKFSCIGRPTSFFFMLDAHISQGIVKRLTVPKPSRQGGKVRSHRARSDTGVLSNRGTGFEATGHITTSEPNLLGRQGPILQDM